MSMDIDDLFEELEETYSSAPKESIGDKIERMAIESFRSMSAEEDERRKEENLLNEQIVKSTNILRRLKNSKNVKHRDINAARAKRRTTLKKEIAMFKLRLAEIQDERRGAGISPSTAIDAQSSEKKVNCDCRSFKTVEEYTDPFGKIMHKQLSKIAPKDSWCDMCLSRDRTLPSLIKAVEFVAKRS